MQFLRVGLVVLTLCATVAPIRAEAQDAFSQRLERWLDEPGVRAVAVEFYSDYCEPCKRAVPRWEALRKAYKSKGLKLVVINVDDYESDRQCKTLPWHPDLLICDKGLAESLGVCTGGPQGSCRVPQAFVWSWQGERLVSGRSHVEEVEQAVKAALDANPRVLVQVAVKTRGAQIDAPLIRRMLEAELSRDQKVQVVVSDEERKALNARAVKTHDVERKEKQRCELSGTISENMVLQADIYSPKRGVGSISLSLQQLTKKCATTVVEDFVTENTAISVKKAVYKLMGRLKQRPPQMPGGARTAATNVTEQVIDSAPKEEWNPESATGAAGFVSFKSKPTGAAVSVNGKTVCQKTPCNRHLPLGTHRVDMSLPDYEKKTQKITLKNKGVVDWQLAENFARVNMDTQPAGVRVELDGNAISLPLKNHKLSLGGHQLTVIDRCYHPRTQEFNVERGKRSAVVVEAKHRVAAVQVMSKDATQNAVLGTVYLGNKALGPTYSVHKVNLCAGTLRVDAPGHGSWSIDLTKHGLVERATTTVNAELGRSARTGNAASLVKPKAPKKGRAFKPRGGQLSVVSFSSTPSGALVEVDGKALCTTPCKRALVKGKHRVVMKLERYVNGTKRLAIRADQEIALTLTPNFGTLVVQTQPAGLPVWVDNKKRGNGPLTLENMAVGRHKVMVKSPCHHNKGQTVNVGRGKTRSISIEPKGKMGAIVVRAKDSKKNDVSTDVLVDGKAVGSTYQTIKVNVCARQIAVQDKTHGNWYETLSLKEKKLVKFTPELSFSARKRMSTTQRGKKAKVLWKGYFFQATIQYLKGGKYCIHYDGWARKWDECVGLNRIQLKGNTKTVFEQGDKVEVMWKRKYFSAHIKSVKHGKYCITYKGYDKKWDECVTPNRVRQKLASARREAPAVGGSISAHKGDLLATFSGHKDTVKFVTYSPNGKRALSASYDKTVKLWDAESGHLIRTFSGHTNYVTSVAMSPNGVLALSGSSDNTLMLWDIKSGERLHVLKGHQSYVSSVAFSPTKKLALSGSWDKTLKLWDVESGRLMRTFKGHSEAVRSVAFSPNGLLALSGSYDKTLKLWDVENGRLLRTYRGHKGKLRSVAFSPNGKLALSGSYDKSVKLWDVKRGRLLSTFLGHRDAVSSVAFSPDGKLALSGSYDKKIKLWNVQSGRMLRTFKGHSSDVNSVAFSPNGQRALSGSQDRTLKLWQLPSDLTAQSEQSSEVAGNENAPVSTVLVSIETNHGTILVKLNPQKAPITVRNFLTYVDAGFYSNTIFHRVIKGFMIQGGGFTPNLKKKSVRSPIKLESNNGLSNSRGTIAMARTGVRDSATSQFFINLVNNQRLDNYGGGYAVFGKVIQGMDVVDKIARVRTIRKRGQNNLPSPPVLIRSVSRVGAVHKTTQSGLDGDFAVSSELGGMGFRGTGVGGGGISGVGRIGGMGKIDTGTGTHSLSRKRPRRIPKLRLGRGFTSGSCNKAEVKRVVLRRAAAIRQCYEQRLNVNPRLKGLVGVKWTIASTGRVSSISITKDTLRDRAITSCIKRVVKQWKFVPPKGGGICHVRWPFVFSSKK